MVRKDNKISSHIQRSQSYLYFLHVQLLSSQFCKIGATHCFLFINHPHNKNTLDGGCPQRGSWSQSPFLDFRCRRREDGFWSNFQMHAAKWPLWMQERWYYISVLYGMPESSCVAIAKQRGCLCTINLKCKKSGLYNWRICIIWKILPSRNCLQFL